MTYQIMTKAILEANLTPLLDWETVSLEAITPDSTIPNLFTVSVSKAIRNRTIESIRMALGLHLQPVDIDDREPTEYTAVWRQPLDDEEPMPLAQATDLAYTPYAPCGIVRVIRVFAARHDSVFAEVNFLHPHKGYGLRTMGGYPRTELQKMILPPELCEKLGIRP